MKLPTSIFISYTIQLHFYNEWDVILYRKVYVIYYTPSTSQRGSQQIELVYDKKKKKINQPPASSLGQLFQPPSLTSTTCCSITLETFNWNCTTLDIWFCLWEIKLIQPTTTYSFHNCINQHGAIKLPPHMHK